MKGHECLEAALWVFLTRMLVREEMAEAQVKPWFEEHGSLGEAPLVFFFV